MAEVAYPEAYLECMRQFYLSITFKASDTQAEAQELWSLDNRTSAAVMFSRMVREAAGGLGLIPRISSDLLQGICHAGCISSFACLVQDMRSLKGNLRDNLTNGPVRLSNSGMQE